MSSRQEIEISFFLIRCRANGIPALVVSFVVVVLALSYVYRSVRAVEVSEARTGIEVTSPAVKEEKEHVLPGRKVELAPTPRKLPGKKEMPTAEWSPFGCWFCVK